MYQVSQRNKLNGTGSSPGKNKIYYYTSYEESLEKENLIGREGHVTIVFSLQQNFLFHPFGTSCSTHSVVSGIFHTFDVKG
jgi:hypothetical protein